MSLNVDEEEGGREGGWGEKGARAERETQRERERGEGGSQDNSG